MNKTPANLEAYTQGRKAYTNGESGAPFSNEWVNRQLEGVAIGTPTTIPLFDSFIAGWHAGQDDELFGMFA